jgi:hypothetical protein
MNLVWGPERIQIYNDANRAFMGTKHPGALCRPGREDGARYGRRTRRGTSVLPDQDPHQSSGGNPFMSKDDARRTGETIRQLFFDARGSMQHRDHRGHRGSHYNVTYGPLCPLCFARAGQGVGPGSGQNHRRERP